MTAGTTKPGGTGTTRVRLGELLVKAGVITDVQLKAALQEQKQWGGKLGDVLVRMKYVSEDIFVRALSKQLGLTRADLNASIPLEALAKIPSEVAEEYEIVPVALSEDGKTLSIATADPLNLTVVDYVRTITKCRVVPQVASAGAVRAAIARLYQIDPDRDSDLKFVTNANDTAYGQTAAPPPVSGLELNSRANSSSGFRPVTNPGQQPASRPGHTTSPNVQPLQMAAGAPSSPGMSPVPMANGGYYPPSVPGPVAAMPQPYPMYPTPGPYALPPQPQYANPGFPVSVAGDEAARRDVVALKALVELLVQKGVISLDEYLARLKRS